jgi:hypothetical protein
MTSSDHRYPPMTCVTCPYMPVVCPWYAQDSRDRKWFPMTDEVSMPNASKSKRIRFVVGIAIVAAAGFTLIVLFAASPRVANAFTAGGTISLAGATVWLGIQTRDAVRINEREMDQNKDLLELTRQQADSATQSTRILADSSRPFVVPKSDGPIWVGVLNERWSVTFDLWNFGSSMALLEDGERRPKLILAHNGDHAAHGKADSVIIPKESGCKVSFSMDPKEVARAGGPVSRPNGTFIAAALDFWFSDSSKRTHYMVHAEFESDDSPDERFVTLLRLTNIEFSDPTVFGSSQISIGGVQIEASAEPH